METKTESENLGSTLPAFTERILGVNILSEMSTEHPDWEHSDREKRQFDPILLTPV